MEITEKHIEELVGHKIILLINLCGSVKGCFLGTIEGRLRNRFKHYIFKADTSYVNFFFTPHDVREIEQNDGTFYVKLGEPDEMDSENKKNKKRKSKKTTRVKVKTKKAKKKLKPISFRYVRGKKKRPVIDLNDMEIISDQSNNTVIMSAQANSIKP